MMPMPPTTSEIPAIEPMLYVLRCAVYFAETPAPDPLRLKWWAWKD